MNNYFVWYRRVVWVGIVVNLALALPTLFAANWMLEVMGLPPATPEMWPSFSANLLILLTLFYIPPAIDPMRYRASAWLTLVARLAGVIFFVGFNQDYLLFGLVDLTFLVPQSILLFLATRNEYWQRRLRSEARFAAPLVAALVLLIAVTGMIGYVKFFRQVAPPHFASDEEHFLYGSVGTEATDGVPYWIWLVLPRVFPDLLPGPGGYSSLGVFAQEGHEMPVGFSKRTIGIERVGINCAICHAGTYRLNPSDKPTVVATAPSHQMNPQGYLRFLFACAKDARFNSTTIMAEIDRNYKLSFLDHAIYKFILIPFTRQTLLKQQSDWTNYGWMKNLPPWGKGRIDPFNPVKYRVLSQPVDGSIGNADMVPLWNQRQHQNYSLHWDGLNTDLQEVVITSAIGDGAPKSWVDADWKKPETESSLRRIKKYITETQPPKFPLAIDSGLAAKGKAVYDRECASCHAFGGDKTGKVQPLDDPNLQTDRHRMDMWTAASATAYNNYAAGYSWKFAKFVKRDGYVNVPLDGIWLRGPYLHNGSVPTLADLLEEPRNRPKLFYRGYDVIDGAKVGFITTGADAERAGYCFDTSVPGNSNAGHLWGTQLSGDDKKAMVEYMKTL